MKITKIEKSKHKQERVLVYTEEGDLLRITEHELLQFGLYTGMELSEELAEALIASAAKSQRRAYAVRVASSRMLSQKELRDKLKRRNAAEEEATETAEWLAGLGAVDDAAYAGVIVRHYAAMGYGAGRVEQELYRRGIPKELWEGALTQLPDPAEAVEAFLRSKLKEKPLDRDSSRKLAAALQRRGFSWNDIRPVLNKLGQEIEE